MCRTSLLAQALGPPGADFWPKNPGMGPGIWAHFGLGPSLYPTIWGLEARTVGVANKMVHRAMMGCERACIVAFALPVVGVANQIWNAKVPRARMVNIISFREHSEIVIIVKQIKGFAGQVKNPSKYQCKAPGNQKGLLLVGYLDKAIDISTLHLAKENRFLEPLG